MKRLGLFLLSALLTIGTTACSRGGGGGSPASEKSGSNPLVGNWKRVRIDKPKGTPIIYKLDTVEFMQDGTILYESFAKKYRIIDQARLEIDGRVLSYGVKGDELAMQCIGMTEAAECSVFFQRAK